MEMSAQKSFDGLKSARGRAKGSVTSFSRLPLDSILPYKCVDLPGALSLIPPPHRKCNNMFLAFWSNDDGRPWCSAGSVASWSMMIQVAGAVHL